MKTKYDKNKITNPKVLRVVKKEEDRQERMLKGGEKWTFYTKEYDDRSHTYSFLSIKGS